MYKAVLTHQDGTWETVAAKRLKKKAISAAGLQDLQREIAILKVRPSVVVSSKALKQP